jgi:hypothetical protein
VNSGLKLRSNDPDYLKAVNREPTCPVITCITGVPIPKAV